MKGYGMHIEDQTVGDAVVVRFDGHLDTTTASDTLAHFDRLVEDGQTRIVADFSSVDFVSSAGLRVLLATAKNIGSAGSLRLFGLNPAVREVFDVSGFSTILAIFDDEAAALAG
jgi:anti-sigma B factor antagonist